MLKVYTFFGPNMKTRLSFQNCGIGGVAQCVGYMEVCTTAPPEKFWRSFLEYKLYRFKEGIFGCTTC